MQRDAAPVVVETSVWIDYLARRDTPQATWLESNLHFVPIALADLTLCELLQGFRNDQQYERVRENLLKFRILETGGRDLALKAAQKYRYLRKRGITVRKTIDCLIANVCIENGLRLLHADRDFQPFEEHLQLLVLHPLQSN